MACQRKKGSLGNNLAYLDKLGNGIMMTDDIACVGT